MDIVDTFSNRNNMVLRMDESLSPFDLTSISSISSNGQFSVGTLRVEPYVNSGFRSNESMINELTNTTRTRVDILETRVAELNTRNERLESLVYHLQGIINRNHLV